jgi:predicted GNAT superfamily acetyltransferase
MIRDATAADHAWMLALNAAHETETAPMDAAFLARLSAAAFRVLVADGEAGFVIGLDQDCFDAGPNWRWFAARHTRFVYVDRIIVAPAARAQGVARALYGGLIAAGRAARHARIVCEYNVDPPNPASAAFHAALGFAPLAEEHLPDRGKTVRYCVLDLAS